ncbi:MAG TPA: hypothetical protein VKW06_22915 [Candidatus Angelobacter sp.]|nr:hypothetical protein [Candidatus Angelobacter sp.]
MATLPRVDHIAKVTPPPPRPAVAKVENVLAFRTRKGGESIKAGQSRDLGLLDVESFSKIRLVIDERMGSTCNVISGSRLPRMTKPLLYWIM